MSMERLGFGQPIQHLEASTVAALLKLLAEAGDAVSRDRTAAKACIDQAAAILESERSDSAQEQATSDGARQVLAPWQIRRVVAHVDANLAGAIRVYDLAQIARLSDGYFSRAFKGSFGLSPQAYVVARRMELARHLMLTTDEPLCQIGLACGLSDQAHFSKMFSRVYGMPPGAWRRQRRGCVFKD